MNEYQREKLGRFTGYFWKDDRAIFNTYTLHIGNSMKRANVLYNYDHFTNRSYDHAVPNWWTIT